MSLSKDQKKEVAKLGEYFKKIERLATENNIDLDVFMSEYKDDGFAEYATEKVSMEGKAVNRKKVFEKSGKEKIEKQVAKKR